MNSSKWTAAKIQALKGNGRIACLTAYDYSTARLVDAAGIELILVGDSLAMTMLGYKSTLPVTMAEMLHHVAAVSRGVHDAMVVADMPFMSYQASIDSALENAGRFVKEAGADGVKVEGGAIRVPVIAAMVKNGIPVLGHIGLTPQSIKAVGGYKVQGRKPEQAATLLRDAQALAEAGVFAVVLECLPPDLACEITKAVRIPTIGIGAGSACDGQILVSHDMLGIYGDVTPKFVKRYADLGADMKRAFETYKREVEGGEFPGAEHCY